MVYSVENLTQVTDCDVLLTWAQKAKADLNFQKLSEERLTTKYAETSIIVDAELQGVITEIAAQDSIIAILPEGPSKQDAVNKKTRLVYKKFLLETRLGSYGAVSLLEKEMDLARVQQEIQEVDAFIAAIQDKKTALAA